MKRQIVLALAALLVLPALALSQETSAPAKRFTVSPFLGYAFTYTQKGAVGLSSPTLALTGTYQREVKGGVMPGIALDYDLPGRFGASAAFAYNKRGTETVTLDDPNMAPMYNPGETLWFVRAAVTMDLLQSDPDLQIHHPLGRLFAGPAFVREVPASVTGRSSANAIGLNLGAIVELPLPWEGFSVQGAFEDYMSHISNAGVATQLGSQYTFDRAELVTADMTHGLTNMYAIRAGLSYKFQPSFLR